MDQNGPLQAKMDHFGPFGLANAKIQFGIKHFDQNGCLDHFGPFWSSTLSDSTAAIPYLYRNTFENIGCGHWDVPCK